MWWGVCLQRVGDLHAVGRVGGCVCARSGAQGACDVGQEDALARGMKYTSNGMWGVHAMGQGESGARGLVVCVQ